MDIDLDALYAVLAPVARNQTWIFYSDVSQQYLERTGHWHEPHGSWDESLGQLNQALNSLRWPPVGGRCPQVRIARARNGTPASCLGLAAAPEQDPRCGRRAFAGGINYFFFYGPGNTSFIEELANLVR